MTSRTNASAGFQPRFITPEQLDELLELYRRTAVGYSTFQPTRHRRLRAAVDMLLEHHPGVSPGGAYKDLDAATEFHLSLTQ